MSVADLTRESIRSLTPYTPGKPLEELAREYGITDAIKLASNENPLGSSPKALNAAQAALAESHRYPDGDSLVLKQALSQHVSIPANQLILGNGSNEILDLITRTVVTSQHEVIFSEYAFLVYPIVTSLVGATARIANACSVESPTPLGHDLKAMAALINEKTRLIFIANPNNPTGTYLSADELKAFIASVPAHVIVVVDEAYFEYVDAEDYPNTALWVDEFPNLLVTRTFSKIYGLAAFRIGYGITNPELCDLLNRVRQPFNTNSLAQVAATAALEDHDFVAQSRQTNQEGLTFFYAACEQLKRPYIPSAGNFLLINVGEHCSAIYEALLKEGVIVRPVAGYGLPDYLRITIGTEQENKRCVAALEKVLRVTDGN